MLDFGQVAETARLAEKAAREGDHASVSKLVAELHTALKAVELGGT
jgi:hypothetical protein